MFTFMKIATFAALAFGTIASAIPAPAPLHAAEAGELVARQSQDVTTILSDMNDDLQAPCAKLKGVSANVSVDVVVEIVAEIKVVIDTAVAACGKASGLGSGDIISLLSVAISLVISACGQCYSICTDKVNILVALQVLDGVLAALITIVLKLVGGVLATVVALLVGLLGTVVEILVNLKFTLCLQALLIL